MILSDIKRYLKQRGQASLTDIALHFDTPPEAVRGMLEQWMRKGKVRRMMATASCGSSCSKCDLAATEIYEWIATGAGKRRPITIPIHCEQNN